MNESNKEKAHPTLDVRITGENLTPETLPFEDLLEFVENYRKALAYVIDPTAENVEYHSNVSLVKITKGSVGLELATNGEERVEQGIRELNKAIKECNYKSLPPNCLKHLRKIEDLATRRKYDFEFSSNNIEEIVPVTAGCNSSFAIPEEISVDGGTIIYAKVLEVSGDNPHARVELEDGSVLDVALSAEMASSVATKLLKVIGLEGTATWTLPEWKITEFKVNSVTPYDSDIKPGDALKSIREAVKDHWDDIEDIGEYIREIKRQL